MMEWNRARSVRQIGSVPGRERIYVEDYVMRFAKRLAAKQSDNEKAAMLLGNQYHYNGQKIVQISGIVEIPQFARRNSPVLSPQSWDSVYTEIKENFTDLDIVGWFYTARDFDRQDAGKLLEIHKANFQHRDKVLYILDEKEQEDGMFLYHMGNFERQQGYYIYYEKNPEMLYYMEKESKRHVHLVEQEDDRVIRNIRGIMEEKEKVKQQKNREKRTGHGLGVVAALAILLLGASTLRSQTTLTQLKNQLGDLKEAATQSRQEDKTVVETLNGKVYTKPPVTVSGGAVSGAAGQETQQGTVAK